MRTRSVCNVLFAVGVTAALSLFILPQLINVAAPAPRTSFAILAGIVLSWVFYCLARSVHSLSRAATKIQHGHNELRRQNDAILRLAASESLYQGDTLTSAEKITEFAAKSLNASHAELWSFDEQQSAAQSLSRYYAADRRTLEHLTLTSASWPQVFFHVKDARVVTTIDDVLYIDGEKRSLVSSVAAPMFVGGTLAGLIRVSDVAGNRRWNEHEQDFVASLADMMALCFQTHQTKKLENELQLRSSAIEASMDGMAILNDKGIYVYVNQAHANVYGFDSPDELLGKHWHILYDEERLKLFRTSLIPQLTEKGELRCETIGKKKDGTPFPQELSLTSIKGGGLICVVRDVSARKIAESEAEKIALFATLNPYPVLRFDKDARITVANPSAENILGLQGRSNASLYEVLPETKNLDLLECISRGSILTATCAINGRHFYFVLRGIPTLSCGHAYGSDISDLKSAEAKVMASEQLLRKVIDIDPNFIFVKDSKGRFRLANEAVAEAYGTTVNELIGKTDADFCSSPDEVEHFRSDDLSVIRTGEEKFIREERITDAKGKIRFLQTVKRPLVIPGETEVLALGVAADITEQRRLQEELYQTQKLEAIGQLAGGIAHDFNNILTGILGYTSLLQLSTDPESETHQTATLIESAANRARELTQKLLGFARKGKHQNIAIDVHRCIRETLSILGRTFEKNISLVQDLRAERICVRGDPVQLQQIILNLAINARDAMSMDPCTKAQCQLIISTRDRKFTVDQDDLSQKLPSGDYLEISVADTGCGIDEAIREKIFEPFFTTKSADRGSGMGLAMVYGIVRNHGGEVTVESEVGKGSTFKVLLPSMLPPLTSAVEKVVTPRAPERASDTQGMILLVDDHSVIRDVTTKMLTSLGYQVITATDGIEAIRYYKEYRDLIDLVIIDMIMPKMGAKECFRAIKEINPNVRAILSTGYVNNNLVQEILNEGMSGFVQKPYKITKLSEVVAEALKH